MDYAAVDTWDQEGMGAVVLLFKRPEGEDKAHLAPALQNLKFQFFGHDMAILHEREIRKSLGPFAFLKNSTKREAFFKCLNALVEQVNFGILSHAIRKDGNHLPEDNLYHMAAQDCLEPLFDKLADLHQETATTHVVFEERGKNEDQQLELEFRRICSGQNKHNTVYPFVPVCASKKANSSGLQFADLVARPIGNAFLYPDQPNRAYDILKKKDIQPDLVQGGFELP